MYIYIYKYIYVYYKYFLKQTNNTPNNQTTFCCCLTSSRSRLCYGLQCGWSFSGFRSESEESSLGGSSLDLSMQLGGEHLRSMKQMALVVVSVVFWGGEKLPNLL